MHQYFNFAVLIQERKYQIELSNNLSDELLLIRRLDPREGHRPKSLDGNHRDRKCQWKW